MTSVAKALLAALLLTGCALGQEASPSPPISPPPRSGEEPRQKANENTPPDVIPERWNLFWQATSIGQYHGRFNAPYAGVNSLLDTPEEDASITTTFFFGWRFDRNTELYFDPEIAGGKGFSATTGIADFPNGEIPRVAGATPKPYIARLYLTHDFALGGRTEAFDDEENQLAGTRPIDRYTVVVGRFTVTDFFQNNRYSNDPRTQYMSWGTMYNGAWDYPADTRGYTWGWMHELHTAYWSFRYGSAFEPKVANGQQFDRRILRDRSDMFEEERRWQVRKHPGAVRVLEYFNRAHAGSYADAIAQAKLNGGVPDVVATRKTGTLKYGFCISADQELTSDIGVFARAGWNDGNTESFAFTAIDHLATEGISVVGRRWRRPKDSAGTALTIGGLSPIHEQYLADGGLDFLIGDGRLRYGWETVWESYYNAQLTRGWFAAFDIQRIANPGYNRDRGPVWVESIRLHLEFGRPDFK